MLPPKRHNHNNNNRLQHPQDPKTPLFPFCATTTPLNSAGITLKRGRSGDFDGGYIPYRDIYPHPSKSHIPGVRKRQHERDGTDAPRRPPFVGFGGGSGGEYARTGPAQRARASGPASWTQTGKGALYSIVCVARGGCATDDRPRCAPGSMICAMIRPPPGRSVPPATPRPPIPRPSPRAPGGAGGGHAITAPSMPSPRKTGKIFWNCS